MSPVLVSTAETKFTEKLANSKASSNSLTRKNMLNWHFVFCKFKIRIPKLVIQYANLKGLHFKS
jgi:hypothetical protein